MSIDEKKRMLAQQRLQQAAESIQEAQYLLAGGKSLRSVANQVIRCACSMGLIISINYRSI
jgi:hypothetical protein